MVTDCDLSIWRIDVRRRRIVWMRKWRNLALSRWVIGVVMSRVDNMRMLRMENGVRIKSIVCISYTMRNDWLVYKGNQVKKTQEWYYIGNIVPVWWGMLGEEFLCGGSWVRLVLDVIGGLIYWYSCEEIMDSIDDSDNCEPIPIMQYFYQTARKSWKFI